MIYSFGYLEPEECFENSSDVVVFGVLVTVRARDVSEFKNIC